MYWRFSRHTKERTEDFLSVDLARIIQIWSKKSIDILRIIINIIIITWSYDILNNSPKNGWFCEISAWISVWEKRKQMSWNHTVNDEHCINVWYMKKKILMFVIELFTIIYSIIMAICYIILFRIMLNDFPSDNTFGNSRINENYLIYHFIKLCKLVSLYFDLLSIGSCMLSNVHV